ncbi:tetratricopeptide repeat protein [Pseudomonas sp. NA13]
MEPDFAAGHHRLATLYFEKGQFAKALQHIERALEISPMTVACSPGKAWSSTGLSATARPSPCSTS